MKSAIERIELLLAKSRERRMRILDALMRYMHAMDHCPECIKQNHAYAKGQLARVEEEVNRLAEELDELCNLQRLCDQGNPQ